jgi:hypothetical protein
MRDETTSKTAARGHVGDLCDGVTSLPCRFCAFPPPPGRYCDRVSCRSLQEPEPQVPSSVFKRPQVSPSVPRSPPASYGRRPPWPVSCVLQTAGTSARCEEPARIRGMGNGAATGSLRGKCVLLPPSAASQHTGGTARAAKAITRQSMRARSILAVERWVTASDRAPLFDSPSDSVERVACVPPGEVSTSGATSALACSLPSINYIFSTLRCKHCPLHPRTYILPLPLVQLRVHAQPRPPDIEANSEFSRAIAGNNGKRRDVSPHRQLPMLPSPTTN